MRRALLGLAGAVALGTVGVLLVGFVWPQATPPDFVNLGPTEDLPVGHARLFPDEVAFSDFRWGVRTSFDDAGILRTSASHDVTFAIVRHEDGTVSAFLARDPRNGCPLAWRTDLSASFGPGGFFRDPCHGSTYNDHGVRVFGPSPRNLDYFDVIISDAGEVVIDLRTLHKGGSTRSTRWEGTPPPTSTAVPGGRSARP